MRAGRVLVLISGVVVGLGWCSFARGQGAPRIVTGNGGASPVEKRFLLSGAPDGAVVAYTPTFSGGVRVAAGDVNGDGWVDMVAAPGPGAEGSHVKVFDGRTLLLMRDIDAYSGFAGGVYVGAGDVNADGFDDIVTGADAGGAPHVKVFSGSGLGELASFFAYGIGFTGGVRVAAGDVNGDGNADIVTGAGGGSGGHVKVFDGVTLGEVRSFLPYGAAYTGGSYVAAGDVNGDGLADLLVGTDSSSPQVKVFSGLDNSELYSFFAYATGFSGGVRVAAGDLNGDGKAEIITGAGPGSLPEVKVFSGADGLLLADFLAEAPGYSGGIFVAAAVPEPSVALMVMVGGAMLARRRGRGQ